MLPVVFPIVYIWFIVIFTYYVGLKCFFKCFIDCWEDPGQKWKAVVGFILSLPITLTLAVFFALWAIVLGPFFSIYGIAIYLKNMMS